MSAFKAGSRLLVSLSVLAAASMQVAHAADPIFSSTVTIGDIRYRLIDLDANDGITPGLTVSGGNWVSTTTLSQAPVSNGDYYGTGLTTPTISGGAGYQVGPLGQGSPVASSTPDNSISLSASSTQASASITASSLNVKSGSAVDGYGSYGYSIDGTNDATGQYGRFTVTSTATQYMSSVIRSASVGTVDGGDLQPVVMQLTANTLLVVEGAATINMSVDRSNLVGSLVTEGGVLPGYYPTAPGQYAWSGGQFGDGSASAVASLRLADTFNGVMFGEFTNGSGSGFSMDKSLSYNADGFSRWDPESQSYVTDEAMVLNIAETQNWTLSVANLGSGSKTVYLGAGLNTDFNQSVSHTETITDVTFTPMDITPSIPEPSTYVLMGLGLAGIALTARRRRTH